MSFVLLGILNSQAAGAGGAGAYDLLETTELTSSASSVSFTGLGSYSDYKHLQIRYTARTTANAGASWGILRFNSDSGSNYSRHNLTGNGSSVYSQSGTSKTSTDGAFWVAGNGNTAGSFGAGVIDILDFSNTSKYSTIRALSGIQSSSGNTDTIIQLGSSAWLNTAAITSILFAETSGNDYAAGSRFSLYGIRG